MNSLRFVNSRQVWYAILLFIQLQIYFASNTLSFGFWNSGEHVFSYMILFYSAWLIGIVILVILGLKACQRFECSLWVVIIGLVLLSLPFGWDLWVRSIETENRLMRYFLRLLLLPVLSFYFWIGFRHIRTIVATILALSLVSFVGHATGHYSIDRDVDYSVFKLNSKPNIHVIMLDALTTSPLTQEFLGIENQATDYLASLDDVKYARPFGYSESSSTRKSWGTLFQLGQSIDKLDYLAFSGQKPSRLTKLLRENGYIISTGFSSTFFGWKKGTWINHYYLHQGSPDLKYDLSCVAGKGKLRFCSKFSRSQFSKIFSSNDERTDHIKEWSDTVIDVIDKAEKNISTPLFSAFHIYLPGHVSNEFVSGDPKMLSEFRQEHSRRIQRVKAFLEKVQQLRKRYPESIFIVSGDHGLHLSRTAPDSERRFKTLDEHGIALALLNASNLCLSSLEWLDSLGYLTPSRMLTASLTCSGKERQLIGNYEDNEEFTRFIRTN